MMNQTNIQLRKVILTGLMTALVYLATSIIKIPTANGYIHFGDGFIFLSALLLGPFFGAFAAGIGSMLADLLSPYAQWALPTFMIKSLMGLMMGLIIRQNTKKQAYVSAGVTLSVWIVFFIMIKGALSRTVKFSMDKLAGALEDTPDNITQLASGVQWKLSAAIVVFFILVFALCYWILKKQQASAFGPIHILGMMSAGSCMIIGYYIAETILYGNPISPAFSVPMNLLQFLTGIVITAAIGPALLKAYASIITGTTGMQDASK